MKFLKLSPFSSALLLSMMSVACGTSGNSSLLGQFASNKHIHVGSVEVSIDGSTYYDYLLTVMNRTSPLYGLKVTVNDPYANNPSNMLAALCVGDLLTHKAAQDCIDNLSYANLEGWRIPSDEEMQELIKLGIWSVNYNGRALMKNSKVWVGAYADSADAFQYATIRPGSELFTRSYMPKDSSDHSLDDLGVSLKIPRLGIIAIKDVAKKKG